MQQAFDEVNRLDHLDETEIHERAFPNAASQLITQQICKDGRIVYVSRVSVGGEEFVGEGRSKQLSKHEMAKSVLAKICPSDLQYLQRLKGETDVQTCNNELDDGLPLEQNQKLVQTESKVAEPIPSRSFPDRVGIGGRLAQMRNTNIACSLAISYGILDMKSDQSLVAL
uniref:DRBM domain-containing protein n=1 Tax=Trichuris muris TaxID=70415 RepID=A0A5S6QVV9_TRIMR